EEITELPRRISRDQVPVAIRLGVARVALRLLAREKSVANAITAGPERAPLAAERQALAGAAEAGIERGTVVGNDVVEFLTPETEIGAAAFRCGEKSTLARTYDAGGLIGHGNGERAHAAGDVGNRRGDCGLHLLRIGQF